MTISSNIRKAGQFVGDGNPADYPFQFKVFNSEDIAAYVADADGNETQLTYPTDYSVTLNPDQETHPGGIVRLTVPLAAGYIMTLISEMAATQPVEFTNQSGFYPRDLNTSLDRLTILVQQLEVQIGRAMKSAVNADSVPTLPLPKDGSVLRWEGGKLVNDAFDIAAVRADIERLRVSVAAVGGQGAAQLGQRITDMETAINGFEANLRKVRILALAGL